MTKTNPLYHSPAKKVEVVAYAAEGKIYCLLCAQDILGEDPTLGTEGRVGVPVLSGEIHFHDAGNACAICEDIIL